MNFMGMGLWEVLLILLVALLVFGPGKLPEIARALGQGMRKFKMATTGLTRDITEELNKETKEVKDEVQKVKDEVKEIKDEVSAEAKDISEGVKKDASLAPESPSKARRKRKKESVKTV